MLAIIIVCAVLASLLFLAALLAAWIYFKVCPKLANALLDKIPPDKRDFNPDESVARPNTEEFFRKDEWYLSESWRELVEICACDGVTLCANSVRAETETDRWIIVMHGYRIDAREMSEFIYRFHCDGWNVLAPDQRAHGFSGGEFTTFGALEKYDMRQWVEFIIKSNPNAKIVLFGGSMGAATVLLTTGLSLPENVKAAVSDSAFVSAAALLKRLLKYKKIPRFPIIPLLFLYVRVRYGVDLKQTDVLSAVRRSATPTLFLHGDKDLVVPFDMLQTLYDAASCEKQMTVCPGAQHTQGYAVNFEMYWDTVLGFVNKYVGKVNEW